MFDDSFFPKSIFFPGGWHRAMEGSSALRLLPQKSKSSIPVSTARLHTACFISTGKTTAIHRLSKVNGLSDLGVSDISLNTAEKILVVAYSNTNVDLIMKDLSIINIPDIKRKEILGNKTINSIMNYGKFAYLSCGFGIVVLNLEKKEIKDTYFIGPDGSSLNVLAMTYNDTAFFAATETGIYYADINDPNLAYYGNWKKMPGIPCPEWIL